MPEAFVMMRMQFPAVFRLTDLDRLQVRWAKAMAHIFHPGRPARGRPVRQLTSSHTEVWQ